MHKTLLKFIALFWSFLAIPSMLSAQITSCCELIDDPVACCFSQPLYEIKMGYFFFTDSKLRKIYDEGGLDVQLSTSYPILYFNDRWTVNAYGAVEYFRRTGQSINGHQKTAVWSIPINIGLKTIYALHPNKQYYFTLGPRFFYLHQHNCSSYVYHNRSRNGVGIFINGGIQYLLCNGLVTDLFGEYSYAKLHFRGRSRVYTRNIQVGGITLGGGLRYAF